MDVVLLLLTHSELQNTPDCTVKLMMTRHVVAVEVWFQIISISEVNGMVTGNVLSGLGT